MQDNAPKNSAAAVWSMVLGILSFVCCGLATAIPAVICGHIGRKNIKESDNQLTGDGMALAGLVLGYINIGLSVITIPLYIAIGIPTFMAANEEATKGRYAFAVESALDQYAQDNNLPSGQMVQWQDFAPFLQNTDMADYDVGDAQLNPVFIVGEAVTYSEPSE